MGEMHLVVLSGGLDSTTALAEAVHEADYIGEVAAISFLYGQKHSVELQCARRITQSYGIRHHRIVNLPEELFKGGVLTTEEEVPEMRYDDLPSGIMSPTYVPFRNGNMLSMAAAYADTLIRESDNTVRIWAGMHAEDAAGFAYADCTPEFLGAMANAIYVGTYGRVRLWTPYSHLAKHQIILRGVHLHAPYHLTHSCYRGMRPACGTCSTCQARLDAFEAAGVTDPLIYKIQERPHA